jgi:hypothetical protein
MLPTGFNEWVVDEVVHFCSVVGSHRTYVRLDLCGKFAQRFDLQTLKALAKEGFLFESEESIKSVLKKAKL